MTFSTQGRRRLGYFLVLGISALVSARAEAQGREALARLADSSTAIAIGRVESLAAAHDGTSIYTYVTLRLTDLIKGAFADRVIVLKQLGGVTPDLGLHIADQARFSPGAEVLVFLSARPRDHTLYTVGLSEGVWPVTRDPQSGTVTATHDGLTIDLSEMHAVASRSARLAGPLALVPPEIAQAPGDSQRATYTFLPEPARWHQADEGEAVPVDYSTAPAGLPGGALPALDGAIAAWNGVGTTLALLRAATGSARCPTTTFSGDGRIVFYWNDPCAEIADTDAVTFGVGGGYYTPGSLRTVNGVVFQQFLQGIAILNNTGPHLASSGCFLDATTHVLGHAVGLGHSDDPDAVMFQTLRGSCDAGSVGLGSDDVAGLRAIYPPAPSGGQAPHAPTAFSAVATLNTVSMDWTPASSGGVVESFIIEAGSAPGLADLGRLTASGTTTSLTVTAVPTGRYYLRVRARNALGTSAASPEAVVTVGSCTMPASPSGLTYTATGNFVSISWVPPVSDGSIQGYIFSAGFGPGQSNALVTRLGPTPSFAGTAPFGDYYVRVQAVNACGAGPASPDLLVSVGACAGTPAAPTGLTATVTGSIVTLHWQAPASGVPPSSYRIVAGTTPGATQTSLDTATDATMLTVTAPSGSYFVRVEAVNACGISPPSNEIRIVVP